MIEHSTPASRPNWRDRAAYRPLLDLDRAGWAWEFLRRNPFYRKAAERLAPPRFERWLMPPLTMISAPGLAPDWGLSFRRSARSGRFGRSALLVSRRRSFDSHRASCRGE